MNHRRISCISLVGLALLVPLLVCSIDLYRATRWSARGTLAQLTGLPPASLTTDDARRALLQRLPIGTPLADVIALVEQHGVEEDRFEGGQLMRYQLQSQRFLLVLLSDPEPLIAFPCSGTTFFLFFAFDDQQRITDIGVDRHTVCL